MKRGFTLAELLIALVILGTVATFTIPKVLQSQQSGQWSTGAKEAASMVSGAFIAYKQQNTLTNTTRASDLTTYMNYVSVDTSSVFDGSGATNDCGAGAPNTRTCLRLHNGGLLQYQLNVRFNGTNNTNFIWYAYDPDPTVDSGNSLVIFLYYNGLLTSWDNCLSGSANNLWTVAPCPDPRAKPSWFSWN